MARRMRWRYRRASLARLLARAGMMAQVAQVYERARRDFRGAPVTAAARAVAPQSGQLAQQVLPSSAARSRIRAFSQSRWSVRSETPRTAASSTKEKPQKNLRSTSSASAGSSAARRIDGTAQRSSSPAPAIGSGAGALESQ